MYRIAGFGESKPVDTCSAPVVEKSRAARKLDPELRQHPVALCGETQAGVLEQTLFIAVPPSTTVSRIVDETGGVEALSEKTS
jgi:hypothetical protein